MSVNSVTDIQKYRGYIDSFIRDEKYSDPHLTAMIEAGESLDDMIAKKDHHCFVTDDRGEITGLYIVLIIPEEKYLEMLIGITRNGSSVEELLSFIEKNYPEYEADFVFNPRNHLIKNSLERRGADFDKEQIKMVYTHKMSEYETASIEPLSDTYIDQYLEMHSKDVY